MDENPQFKRVPSVRFERLIPGPVERVWDYLVDTERLPGWFGDATIEQHEGGAVSLMGGHIRGVVTRWLPGRRLAYTWNVFAPGQDESDYPESYVTFELSAQDEDVLL